MIEGPKPGREREPIIVVKQYDNRPLIGAALEALDLSIDGFADRADVHRTTVYRWLREGKAPRWAAWIIPLQLERKRIGETR